MHVRASAMTLTTAFVMTGLLAGASLPAFSTEPQPAPPSSAPTFATPAVAPLSAPPAKAPGAGPAPPAAVVAPSPDAAAAAEATARSAHALGYSPRVRDGKTVYCRKESKVGTRLESTTCVTAEQVSALVIRAQGNRESVVDLQRESYKSARRRLGPKHKPTQRPYVSLIPRPQLRRAAIAYALLVGLQGVCTRYFLAERVRFELTSPVKGCRFSRPVHSTALPPLRRLRRGSGL